LALTLVILAAGTGSRFGGPKQLEPLGPSGELLLDYGIHDARRAGFERVVLVIRRETRELFEAAVGARYRGRIPVSFVEQSVDALPSGFRRPAERTKPWGTGQAVLAAAPEIDDSFIVANADDFYGANAYRLLAEFLRAPASAPASAPAPSGSATYGLVGYPLRETLTEHGAVNRARCLADTDGWLQEIEEIIGIVPEGEGGRYAGPAGEPRHLSGDTPVSMNIWGFTPAIFPQLESGFRSFLETEGDQPRSEFLLPDELQRLIRRGEARVRLLEGGTDWTGVTHPEDRARVAEYLRQVTGRAYPPALPS
jgi:NDP-sugar pyrophosphorylase family protein